MKQHIATLKKNRRGLSLIDLTVTILILGILIGVTAPRFSESISYFRAESAAERLAADLRMARKFAINKSQTQTIRFSLKENSYSIISLEDPDRPGNRYQVLVSDYPYHATFAKMSFSDSTPISIDINGQMSLTGEVLIRSGSTTKSVKFEAVSGEVSVL